VTNFLTEKEFHQALPNLRKFVAIIQKPVLRRIIFEKGFKKDSGYR
jgi:hypothetical protein